MAWVAAPLAGWAVIASPYVIQISGETGSLTLSKKKSTSSMVRSLTPIPQGAADPRTDEAEHEAHDHRRPPAKRAFQSAIAVL